MLPLETYYPLEDCDARPMHERVYEAIHEKRANLADRAVMIKWIAEQGVDAKKFEATTTPSASIARRSVPAAHPQLPRYRHTLRRCRGQVPDRPLADAAADGNVDPNRFSRC